MSIRLRLSLWYGALLAAVLAASLSVAFIVHVTAHQADVDGALRSSWDHTVDELASTAMPGMPMHPVAFASLVSIGEPTVLWVLAADRSIVSSDGQSGDAVLSLIQPAAVPDGLHDLGTAAGRARTLSGAIPSVPGARLVIAASVAAQDASVDRLRWILLVMGAAGVAVAVSGGWAISAGALRPVAQMTETARAIALSRGFSRRIAVRADASDELSVLGQTFNQMLGSLDDAYRRQQRFVADVSHELRTPLTAIQGDLELLARGHLDPSDATATLAEASHEARRLSRLVDDLLVLARADAGPQPFVGKLVPLDEVVMEGFRELRGQAGERLRVTGLDPMVVFGESDRLKQLQLILLDNALSYTPAGGEVRLALARDGDEAVLTVEDEGIGMDPEVVAHAFERFYRGEQAQQLDPGGTGLGLSIARWIVERHGGSIALEPRAPRGTRVVVRLPAGRDQIAIGASTA